MQTQRAPADDETIAEGCQYELSSIAAVLIDEEAGASRCKRVGLLLDVTTPSEVSQVQKLHFAAEFKVLGRSI